MNAAGVAGSRRELRAREREHCGHDKMSERAELAADLEAVAGGDEDALRRLWDAAGASLFGLCLRLMRRRHAAEDVLQESFVRIWQQAHRYDPARGDPFGWMAAVTRNVALDHLRRERSRGDAELEELDPELAAAPLPDPAHADPDLARCLERLAPMQRRAILLAYYQGLTHTELATTLDVPLGTVKSWVRRGLLDLRECLDS